MEIGFSWDWLKEVMDDVWWVSNVCGVGVGVIVVIDFVVCVYLYLMLMKKYIGLLWYSFCLFVLKRVSCLELNLIVLAV